MLTEHDPASADVSTFPADEPALTDQARPEAGVEQAEPVETETDRLTEEAYGAPSDVEAPTEGEDDAAPLGPSEEVVPEASMPEEGEFAQLGLSEEVLRAVGDKGYRTPTPIQAQAIPVVLMGRDVLGCAQTGTGKTASFTLPLLDILSGRRARARMPRCLILEPTRELALQVAENFVEYGKYLKLTHALLIGGESLGDQRKVLMAGVDVLIATPGRLMDLFERGGLLLTDTRILVIDEADRMLDMGFIPDVEKIVGMLPAQHQTLFFSATMAPEIRKLADAFLREPKEITVSRPASVATTIVAGLALVDELDKREALRRLIRSENVGNALIFCNRKRDVDVLYKSLQKHGFSVGALHGDMSQPERFATLNRFKGGELQLMVCSDVAARGIDIGGLSHVFNFDVPIHAEDYVHRIGRTGRAGLTGHAFMLATPDDRLHVEAIEKLIGNPVPRMAVEGIATAEWAEGDGRRRRGSRTPARTREPARRARPAPSEPGAPQPEVAEKPRRARAAPSRERTTSGRTTNERDADGHKGVESRTGERAASDRGSARREAERPERSRPIARDRDRNERYRRDDDLGPPVQGFGDDVPAFMLLRAGRRPEIQSPE